MKLNKISKKGDMYQFVTHTANIIKGICKHDCQYCYMGVKGNLKEVRLDEKEFKVKTKEGNFIFVGSGTDMFASSLPKEWISKTLDHCNESNNEYLFQSKNPARILEFIEHPVFKKSVVCTTLESNRCYPQMGEAPKIEDRVSAMEIISSKGIDTYVTIEPIMDFDLEEFIALIKRCNPKQVNIGANSYSNKFELPEPSRDKILELIEKLSEFTVVKQKKNLDRLINIEKAMKKELENVEKQAAISLLMPVQIMEETEDGCVTPKIEHRKFALIEHNRPILDKHVYYFLQIIHSGKYNRKMPLLTIEATQVIDECELVDFEGNPISKETASEYLVVLDGQHRIKAFTKMNEVNKGTDKIITIPNVHIENNIENVAEYLVDINTAGHDWSLADKYCVAAINTENKTVRKIHELIKKGFNASAAAYLCTGKKISSAQLQKLLKGDASFISEEKKNDLVNRAEQYLVKGTSILGDNIRMLSKRYYAIGFTMFAASRSTEEAIQALEFLTKEDFKSARDEASFIEVLKRTLEGSKLAG